MWRFASRVTPPGRSRAGRDERRMASCRDQCDNHAQATSCGLTRLATVLISMRSAARDDKGRPNFEAHARNAIQLHGAPPCDCYCVRAGLPDGRFRPHLASLRCDGGLCAFAPCAEHAGRFSGCGQEGAVGPRPLLRLHDGGDARLGAGDCGGPRNGGARGRSARQHPRASARSGTSTTHLHGLNTFAAPA
jgi:hypothetical protein